jgi:hypothetical protein
MNPYLTGNPVYRGASNAPTRGTVDPMGYINRSLASPVGGDGMSDKRSGLAQAALMRLQGMQGPSSGGSSNQQELLHRIQKQSLTHHFLIWDLQLALQGN